MKILLATDGSPHSRCAEEAVADRPWPTGTEVRIISVAHALIPQVADPTLTGLAMHEQSLENAREHATAVIRRATAHLAEHSPPLQVSSAMPDGSPKQEILDEAERWGADLVVIGSHGLGSIRRFLLGSVSHAVVLHAGCSVEIVRCGVDRQETD